MNTVYKYSSVLNDLKKEYRKVSLQLRRVIKTKQSCEDAEYLGYYPHILVNLSLLSDDKRIISKDIRVYSKLLKESLK
jgi:hypothetical protein